MADRAAIFDPSLELDLDDFFENGTIGLHLVGKDGTILRANRADFEPLGYSADEYIGQPITRFHADPETIEDILNRLSAGEKLDKYPARLRAKDGSIRHVHISSSVCFREGEFVNTRCFTVDVTDKVKAEEALRDAQERLATTFETALAGIAEVDKAGRFLRVNQAFTRITGYSREELLERDIFDITHPGDQARERRQFAEQAAGDAGQYLDEKRCVTRDGRVIWVEVLSATVPDGEGGFAYGVRTIVDVTERKLAEAQKKLLLDELNHRVKNTLATVQALAAHTARNATSAEDFRRRFEPRLFALSAAHDRLTRNDWRGCNLADIVTGELSAHGAEAPRLSARGPDLVLPPRACLSLSMALHELATNAAKYGALSVPEGRIDVRWSGAGEPSRPETLSLEWAEKGGPPVSEPDVKGFGSRLLRVTAAELGARMEADFAPSGFRWKLSMPLADGESAEREAAC